MCRRMHCTIQPAVVFFFCIFVFKIICTSFIKKSSFVNEPPPPLVESSKPCQRKIDRKGKMRGSLLSRSAFIVNISTLGVIHTRAGGKSITLWLFPGCPKTLNHVLQSVYLECVSFLGCVHASCADKIN